MEKVIQEFRIIETDDGFRIEIKGDKEQLRDFVMNLDPRRWMHHQGPEWGPPPFGPRMWRMRSRRGGPGPFGFAWGFCEDDEDDDEPPRRKRGQRRRQERGGEETDAV
jgi:hypothetical protein